MSVTREGDGRTLTTLNRHRYGCEELRNQPVRPERSRGTFFVTECPGGSSHPLTPTLSPPGERENRG
jgi:hypothetical protein